jgi:hypothetical protein
MHEIESVTPSSQGFIFSFNGKTPISGFSKMKKRFNAELGEDFEPWTLHDMRTAMATALVEYDFAENVVDRVQNNQASGSAPSAVSRVYNQAELLPQRAEALDKWAEIVTHVP